MADANKSWEVGSDGLSIENGVQIFSGPDDPNTSPPLNAAPGSIYLRTTGQQYRLNNAVTTWNEEPTGSGGSSVNGSNIDTQQAIATANQTTGSTVYVDLAGATLTTQVMNGGMKKYTVIFTGSFSLSGSSAQIYMIFSVNGVNIASSEIFIDPPGSNKAGAIALAMVTEALAAGIVIKCRWRVTGSTGKLKNGTLCIMGVS